MFISLLKLTQFIEQTPFYFRDKTFRCGGIIKDRRTIIFASCIMTKDCYTIIFACGAVIEDCRRTISDRRAMTKDRCTIIFICSATTKDYCTTISACSVMIKDYRSVILVSRTLDLVYKGIGIALFTACFLCSLKYS